MPSPRTPRTPRTARRRYVGLVAALLAALVLGAAPSAGTAGSGGSVGPSATPSQEAGPTPTPAARRRGGVVVLGDSTLMRAADVLATRQPDWWLDYCPGRQPAALPRLLRRQLHRVDPSPAHVVVALGTNPADPEEWTRRRLVRTLDLLPATTHVHLLQVVRVGAGRVQRGRDELLRRYDRWHRRIARTRPRTHLVPWRTQVLADPTLDTRTGRSSLIEDGTHQTGSSYRHAVPGPGVARWTALLERSVARVDPSAVRALPAAPYLPWPGAHLAAQHPVSLPYAGVAFTHDDPATCTTLRRRP